MTRTKTGIPSRLGSFRKNGNHVFIAAISFLHRQRGTLVCHHSHLRRRQHGGEVCRQLNSSFPFEVRDAFVEVMKYCDNIYPQVLGIR